MPEIMDWLREEGIEIGIAGGAAEGEAKGRAKGLAEGLEKGLEKARLEDARKMREHGIAWDIVADVTGIRPEDLTKSV